MIASESEITACQFHKWYDLFTATTFKSRIISLPPEFIDYLGEDGVILPASSQHYFGTDALSDDEGDKLRELEEDPSSAIHDFSELDKLIGAAIKELAGEVMVKLNWSAPSDAIWANGGSLKCKCASDIYMLLKSSDRVIFDLEKMFNLCCPQKLPKSEVTLVLRKWANLNPAMEFRVFVHDKAIVGICQRDCCTYYDFLEAKLDHIQDLIYQSFYGTGTDSRNAKATGTKASIRDIFPLEHYAYDVYVDQKDRVWVEDFNPFGEPTCALLFEWEELASTPPAVNASTVQTKEADATVFDRTLQAATERLANDSAAVGSLQPQHDFCEFRIVESAGEVLPSTKGCSRGPIDVHAASEFKSFMDICKAQHAAGEEDDSSGECD